MVIVALVAVVVVLLLRDDDASTTESAAPTTTRGEEKSAETSVSTTSTTAASTPTTKEAWSESSGVSTTTTVAGPPPSLDFDLLPIEGETSLSSGFVPDPESVGVDAGGPVDVSYLGPGCTGFATEAPTWSVDYTAGVFPSLRFYAISVDDVALVVNTPWGEWVCNDDSFGTLDPTIDFNNPESGRYDVWVATYFPTPPSAFATLYVTEQLENHP